MPPSENILNKKFSRLTAIKCTEKRKDGRVVWLFRCDCGNEKHLVGARVKSGVIKSCGCLRNEASKRNCLKYTQTHGHSGQNPSPTYISWSRVKARAKRDWGPYKDVTMCESWDKFENFLEDMGERPEGCSIDRIDNYKGYFKDNCRWATSKEQSRNRRNTRTMTINNIERPIFEWCEFFGMPTRLVRERHVDQGWPAIRALTEPININKRTNNVK